jgi:hypothetical protein
MLLNIALRKHLKVVGETAGSISRWMQAIAGEILAFIAEMQVLLFGTGKLLAPGIKMLAIAIQSSAAWAGKVCFLDTVLQQHGDDFWMILGQIQTAASAINSTGRNQICCLVVFHKSGSC